MFNPTTSIVTHQAGKYLINALHVNEGEGKYEYEDKNFQNQQKHSLQTILSPTATTWKEVIRIYTSSPHFPTTASLST